MKELKKTGFKIIENIKLNWDNEIAILCEQLIEKALTNEHIFQIGQDYKRLAEILNDVTEDYPIKLLYKSKDRNLFRINLVYLCAEIIKVNQVEYFVQKPKKLIIQSLLFKFFRQVVYLTKQYMRWAESILKKNIRLQKKKERI